MDDGTMVADRAASAPTSRGSKLGRGPQAVEAAELARLSAFAAEADAEGPAPSAPLTVAALRRLQAGPSGRSTAWASALVVFSGAGHEFDLAARLRARGITVEAYDTKAGGARHDVLRGGLGRTLEARVRRGEFDMVFIATPCASYSVGHRPQLRARRWPMGLPNAPEAWRHYIAKHNQLAGLSARLIGAAEAAGAAWAIENPADRGDASSPARWEKHADHAPLWLMPAVRDAIASAHGIMRTFAQCAFAAKVQKWTTIAHSRGLSAEMAPLAERVCAHGRVSHEERAYGLAPDGSSNSAAAAAYPEAMNEFLAEALATWARRQIAEQHGLVRTMRGGRVADGHRLGVEVAAACEDARTAPPRFASMRNRRAASTATLRKAALPGDLHAPPSKPTHRHQASCPTHMAGGPDDEMADARAERMAQGPIAIDELYLNGVYEGEIASWMRLADEATAALRAGKRANLVPTRTIGQAQMQPWARGIVWDCANPADCRPVRRSDRHTVFVGERQINRTALRRAAAALKWHDGDIVGQAGEGGVEVRSECPLDTVLSFHHGGLADAVEAATKVVETDWREQWADRPVRHLPFVPIRLLPRNVIMQERSRLVPSPDGGAPSVELYLKPRVTQDSSLGAAEGLGSAVNAGVPDDERAVELPTVQQHGRSVAICDEAGGDEANACSYVVDAESAYRFCPVQEADLWTQCFVWWDDAGVAGVCVDRRLGFGGAFAPNRFERISTLVAAHVQAKQAAFDASQPQLGAVSRWASERQALQAQGELPGGEAQLAPRHLQVYIDDFMGTALDDVVETPPEVAGIVIDARQVRSEGGVPADPGTRVYVHAQLTVLGLTDVGLSAAPSKVVVGDPVVALGMRVSRAARRIDCPPLKRAAVLADIAGQRQLAKDERRVVRKPAERLVGRLCNLSQVYPELKSVLHGGYAVTEATWSTGGWRRRPLAIQLGLGSTAATGWAALLDVAEQLLEDNNGVDLAPELIFPSRSAPGMDTVTSDASGVDGVGGYAFDAADPFTVWLVSEWWPADVKMALQAAAAGGSGGRRAGSLSMPAAELFGSVAVAAAVAEARGSVAMAVTAIGDCDPAVGAINAATSGNPQMRALLDAARVASSQWLAVSVPREANVDADRLSHPGMLADVVADAEAAGLRVRFAAIPEACWAALRNAIALGTG